MFKEEIEQEEFGTQVEIERNDKTGINRSMKEDEMLDIRIHECIDFFVGVYSFEW